MTTESAGQKFPYSSSLPEEELKIRVARDWFSRFDCAGILGRVDFSAAITDPTKDPEHTQFLVWAEAKAGTKKDSCESLVQLILTIGKERTIEHYLPPMFLAAFDAEKIAFLPYYKISAVFSQNDFNWNVTPSDHDSKEFKQLFSLSEKILREDTLLFSFAEQTNELKEFIKNNSTYENFGITKISVTKNNFISVYSKWLVKVRPSINANWERLKAVGIIDADFYLADLISLDNMSIKDKLFALLKHDHYDLVRGVDDLGLMTISNVSFKDNQKAHADFWKIYKRPPKEEYWDYIINRRDLLVPQDVRERKGSFFTPSQWVDLSQEYLAQVLGENWQDEYYIWDCCAGTGNMEAGLTNKRRIWASTLDKADVDVMKDRIANGANMLEDHVFQFDFLNDSFDKLPSGLKKIIDNPEKRKKLIIYINPPYAEVSGKKINEDSSKGKKGVNDTKIHSLYMSQLGTAGRELYAQFFIRIINEISGCIIGEFSTLKLLTGPAFNIFRQYFTPLLKKLFIVPANTFDNVTGEFPIGFLIWDSSQNKKFTSCTADVFSKEGSLLQRKTIQYTDPSKNINKWINKYREAKKNNSCIGFIDGLNSNDFQHNSYIYIKLSNTTIKKPRGFWIIPDNLLPICVYFAVRKRYESTWLTNSDQFLYPKMSWQKDIDFQLDCLSYTLFAPKNNIQSEQGINHWIPFTEDEVNCKEEFDSHFMTDYIRGKIKKGNSDSLITSKSSIPCTPLKFSEKAAAVFAAGRKLWTYYHSMPNSNPNASLYDIKEFFQGRNNKGRMNNSSEDATYNGLINALRESLEELSKQIEPKIYEHGFLIK